MEGYGGGAGVNYRHVSWWLALVALLAAPCGCAKPRATPQLVPCRAHAEDVGCARGKTWDGKDTISIPVPDQAGWSSGVIILEPESSVEERL